MSEMNFNFLLDKDTYKDALDGAVKLYGKAKKRLPRAFGRAKSAGEKAADFLEAHKTEAIVVGGALAILGVTGIAVTLGKRRAEKRLERTLDAYLVGMKNGTLTPGFLANFLAELERGKGLALSEKQLDTVYGFTVKLAVANGVEADLTRESLDFKKCLFIQKQALENMSE